MLCSCPPLLVPYSHPLLVVFPCSFLPCPAQEAAGRVMQDFEDIDRELGSDHDWSVPAFVSP